MNRTWALPISKCMVVLGAYSSILYIGLYIGSELLTSLSISTRIYKYENIQVQEYTNTRIYKYENIQV